MRLDEIFSAGTKFKEFSKTDIDKAEFYVKNSSIKDVDLEGGAYCLKITPSDFYGLFKDEEFIGWAKIENSSKKNADLRLIYIQPKFRKTKAFLIFLNAIKSELKKPIAIDGAIFKDGEDVLKSLSKRNLFKVKVVDSDTGKEEDFTGEVPNDKKKYIVVEGFDFPLGERYFAPGGGFVDQSFVLFD